MLYSYKDLINELNNMGLNGSETIMVHSSFSSIKNIEGGAETVIKAFKDFFKDGLLLFPTHTWGIIKNDGDVLDIKLPNSNVGYLTNKVIEDSDFIRSIHPTHSVCAYGKDRLKWIKDDINSTTPVSPNGSFGKLKDGDYILFIGCPLSKNTFVHSIEEEMNVENRFTNHYYKFYVKDYNNKLIEFNIKRHFSTLNPHISDNYEKLLPILLKLNIAKKVKFMDSISYLVDSKLLYKLVKEFLKYDIHSFDDDRDLKKYLNFINY
ncbi:MAG: AAC(3) family N-acetyltransferase [Acholeplasmatales bacterium]|nr:AAC(3) family N-acetyltransferase [Acholeplasmatales bacterium]